MGEYDEYGAVFRIKWDTEGQEQLEFTEVKLGELTDAQRQHNVELRATTMVVTSLAHAGLALTGAIIANSGATREQIKMYQTFHAVASAVLAVIVALRVAMMFVPGGQAIGGVSRGAGLLGAFMHEGGYGSNKMQIIQSGERVVPAHRVTNNYGGGITIQNMSVSGSGGKELARDFTQELESQLQRGMRPPAWP